MRSLRSQMRAARCVVEEEQELPIRRGTQLLDLSPMGGIGPGCLVSLRIEGTKLEPAGKVADGQAPAVAGDPECERLGRAVIAVPSAGGPSPAIRQTQSSPVSSTHAAR